MIRLLRRGLVIAALLTVVLILAGAVYVQIVGFLIDRDSRITTEGGIQILEQVELGGVDQWISIRGNDRDNPVLLFLHGGPGVSAMAMMRSHNRELEEHFVVVHWEQRGTGKSYAAGVEGSLTLEQFVIDVGELTDLLRARFGQEKIYLVGHSWGTMIGTLAAERYPERYRAFVGVGQAVNFAEGEKISYRYTLEMAERLENERAMQDLKSIGEPPYREDGLRRTSVQRQWLTRFGGVNYRERSPLRQDLSFIHAWLTAPEYTVMDAVNVLRGTRMSTEALWDDMLAVDFMQQVPELAVPVFFLMGRYDYVTVFELVEDYYRQLQAPIKQLIWFERSAHSPNFEQPEKFVEVMVTVILPLTRDW